MPLPRLAPALCLLLALGASASAADGPPRRPNIVFVFSDDHATQAIGAYGSRINQTPNIDRIAQQGAVFRNSFCANSLCGPSRACILTGKHSHLNGFLRNGNRFDPQQTTFPRLLQQAGYQTAVIGKWHLGTDPVGFDYWEVLPGQGNYYNPDLLQMDGGRKRYEGYCTDIVTDLALEWLSERDSDQPFLLMCQHKAPHRNWSPAERHLGMFDGVQIPEPETLFDDLSGRSSLLLENEMSLAGHFHWGHDAKFHGENQLPQYFQGRHGNGEYARMNEAQKAAWDAHYEPLNQDFLRRVQAGEMSDEDVLRWKYQRYIKDYLATITAVDDSVGRLMQHLEETGQAENTVFIYSSDQGFYLGEHGWYDKRWMFEESLKMPLLVRWPGVIEPGTESLSLVQNIDYGPTFLEMAGAPVPAEMQGRSLVPLMEQGQEPADWREAIYYAYYENASVHEVPIHDGVRGDRYKLMFFPRTREWQLFDLQEDPQELRSVHGDPAYSKVLAGMQKRYRDLRQFYDVNPAAIPMTRGDEDWWRDRFRSSNQQLGEGTARLLFVGDSITQGWEGAGKAVWDLHYGSRQAVNLGFSGDRTEHALFRLRNGRLNAVKPSAVVMMIGTNNTGHAMQDPDQVAEGVQLLLTELEQRCPDARILLLGVFPRGREPHDAGRLNNEAINQRIRRLASDKVRTMDLRDSFLDAEGRLPEALMPDALHLSAEGYRLWAEAIEPVLTEWGL